MFFILSYVRTVQHVIGFVLCGSSGTKLLI